MRAPLLLLGFLLAAVLVAVAVAAEPGNDPARTSAATTAPAEATRPTPAPERDPEPLPAPDARMPGTAPALAERLARTTQRLRAAVDAWRDRDAAGVPRDVELLALHQQRLYRRLASDPDLARAVVRRLRGSSRAEARDVIAAMAALRVLNAPQPGRRRPRIRIGRPEPADRLRAHYRRAWRRFGVGPPLLAAVNFVESAFGRLRNDSHAGAQGPMQFIPATWAAYGAGGDVRDPRDAIMGAARYLHANGAPGDEARALYHYNPSSLYVTAVSRYARAIRRDWRAYYGFYAWQVHIRGRRVTGPGR